MNEIIRKLCGMAMAATLSIPVFATDYSQVQKDYQQAADAIGASLQKAYQSASSQQERDEISQGKGIDLSAHKKQFRQRVEDAPGELKNAYHLAEFFLLFKLQEVDAARIEDLTRLISADDDGWSAFPELAAHMSYALPEYMGDASSQYVEKLKAHPSSKVRSSIEALEVVSLLKVGKVSEARELYNRLEKLHRDLATVRYAASHLPPKGLGNGESAPEFRVADSNDPSVSFTKESFKDKYVLLDFWATWCGPCIKELPNLLEAYRQFHARGFDILSISADREPDAVKTFLDSGKAEMPWHHASGFENGNVSPVISDYNAMSLPALYLIGPDGKVVASNSQLRGQNLQKTLNGLFSEKGGE